MNTSSNPNGMPSGESPPSAPLSIAQAATLLGLSQRTLRRRVADGKIAAVKGSSPATAAAWFIEPDVMDALLRGARKAPLAQEKGEPAPVPSLPDEEETAPVALLPLLEWMEELAAQNARLEERIEGIERDSKREREQERRQNARILALIGALWRRSLALFILPRGAPAPSTPENEAALVASSDSPASPHPAISHPPSPCQLPSSSDAPDSLRARVKPSNPV